MTTVSSNNNNQGTSSFPYSLQPQPPPHPKTTGGKRGPSAPITIPSWARGEEDEGDSDHSITDHTPPSHTGRLAGLDTSLNNGAALSLSGSPNPRAPTIVYVSNTINSPRGLSTAKKLGTGISSPRTLFNNNNAVTLNLNHSLSSSASAPASSAPVSTPILIIHSNNSSSSKASVVENISNNISSSNLSGSGSSLFVPTNSIPASGNGLTTSHPPAPWVSSQSNNSSISNISTTTGTSAKHGNLSTASTSLSKVPRLVDNPIQPKEANSVFSLKGLKSSDSHLPACSSLQSNDPPSFTQTSLTTTTTLPVHVLVANKTQNNPTNTLIVGIPDSIVAPKSECSAGSTLQQLSPTEAAQASSEGDAPVNSPTSSSSNSCFAYELDHDYENVASPCSSTASGPTYVRQPGFRHHAHEVTLPAGGSTTAAASSSNGTNASLFSASLSPAGNGAIGSSNAFRLKKKKCSAMLVNFREGYKKREATPPKLKPKREPLPMKLRALPQSFWQQPNVAHQVSPATLFPILPPLPNKDTEETLMDVRPVTPPEDREAHRKSQPPERKLTVANTDLLFKLFDVVADDKKTSVHKTRQQSKVARKPVPKSNTKGLFLGNDPYMVDAVTEKIFPQLTLEAGSRSHGYQAGAGNSSLQLISLKEGDRTVQLPSLSMEQNYPQMLSELVMHI